MLRREASATTNMRLKPLCADALWSKIARMRDNLIHRYFQVDPDILWIVAKYKAPKLKTEAIKLHKIACRSEYLEYQNKLNLKPSNNSSFFLKIDEQEKNDVMIAKTLLSEYPTEFQKIAVAKVGDIIKSSDRAIELDTNSDSMTPDQYAARITNRVLQSQKSRQNKKADREL